MTAISPDIFSSLFFPQHAGITGVCTFKAFHAISCPENAPFRLPEPDITGSSCQVPTHARVKEYLFKPHSAVASIPIQAPQQVKQARPELVEAACPELVEAAPSNTFYP